MYTDGQNHMRQEASECMIIVTRVMPFMRTGVMIANNKSSLPAADHLSLSLQPKLLNQLSPNEKVVFSAQIQKLNEDNKSQTRIFLLTNHAVYNILKPESIFRKLFTNSFTIRRRVPLLAVYGISIGKGGHSFVLHVINEHDYFYKTEDDCSMLVRYVAREYQAMVGKPLNIYRKEDIVLVNYCTHKHHIKEKKDMKPKDLPFNIPACEFPQILEDIPLQKPQLVYFLSQNASFDCWKQVCNNDSYLKDGRYYWMTKKQGKFQKKPKQQNFKWNQRRILQTQFIYQDRDEIIELMPFMLGGSLLDQAKTRIMKREQALFHLAQMVLLVQSLHTQWHMLESLTLSNTFVSSSGYLFFKINPAPFQGFASSYQIPANYLPPEDILCEGHSGSMDVWMLGVCAWRLLQGKWPFEGNSVKEVFGEIINKDLIGGQPLIRKMLSKQPSERPPIAQIKADSLFSSIKWDQIDDEFLKPPYLPDPSYLKQHFSSILLFQNPK